MGITNSLGKLTPREGIVVLLVAACLESVMLQPGGISLGLIPRRQDSEGWVYAKEDVIRDFVKRAPLVRMRVGRPEIEFALECLGDRWRLNALDHFSVRAILPMVKKVEATPLTPSGFDVEMYRILEGSGWTKGDEKVQMKGLLRAWKKLGG